MATRKTVVLKNEKGREITVSEGRVRVFEQNGWKVDKTATKATEKEAAAS